MSDVTENDVAKQIVDAAYRLHTSLGPGLLESACEAVLSFELENRRLRVARQQAVPIIDHGTRKASHESPTGCRIDLTQGRQAR